MTVAETRSGAADQDAQSPTANGKHFSPTTEAASTAGHHQPYVKPITSSPIHKAEKPASTTTRTRIRTATPPHAITAQNREEQSKPDQNQSQKPSPVTLW